jgi:hypothetical protein
VARDPNLNGHLHHHNDIDRSLNEAATDKIRKYRADYDNNPPNAISFMPTIAHSGSPTGLGLALKDTFLVPNLVPRRSVRMES